MSAEGGGRVVGEYVVGRQIGWGSYSVVWHGLHRVRGTEVAIKEIAVERLSSKLRDSLLSEIVILKKIDHPNIIRLHDIIETPGKIHIVLEYCKGGDLSVYIKRHGVVAEPTAKYFLQQLAAGLQVLRENHLIHRDLKPQNLLLSSRDDHPVLKIADFGFARSLQPRSLAETLCGSPLYMAPEIMQLQKYDAKADLWSVGAILYQLVTGKTPFTGNNQVQLLQNIMKSRELQFPPSKSDLSFECLDLCQKLLRRNPVERLTFEEFFGHSFVSPFALNESLREKGESCGRSSVACDLINRVNENSHGVCLPVVLDGNHRAIGVKSFSAAGLSAPNQHANASNCMDMTFQDPVVQKGVKTNSRQSFSVSAKVNHGRFDNSVDSRQMKFSKGIDSLEWIIRDYVFVSVPPVEEMLSSVNASCHSVFKSGSSPRASAIGSKLSAPVPINASALRACECGILGSNCSAPSGASHGSTNQGEVLERSSSYYMSRIQLLLRCASIVRELVAKKIESGEQLQAFAIQLVVLAIWKQTLHVCHSDAASAAEESASMDIHSSKGTTSISGRKMHLNRRDSHGSNKEFRESAIDCSRIEREFLLDVGQAEELASDLGLSDGNTEMPDAVEIIFRSALELGRRGAADEWVGEKDGAVACYEKAVQLLSFLLVEAPVILNPPLSLTTSDRSRLRSYIDILSNRHKYSNSQRMTFLNEDQLS